MDYPRQCKGGLSSSFRTFFPALPVRRPACICTALPQRGRAAGRASSAWAWPGPLSWRDASGQGRDASTWPSVPVAPEVPPERQPNTDHHRRISSGSSSSSGGGVDHRTSKDLRSVKTGSSTTSNNRGGDANSGGDGVQRLQTPIAEPEMQQRRSPQHPQPQAAADNTVVTFAYGANMNFLTLARREVRVLSRDPAMVVDPAVRLVFKHQGGYATLERAEGSEKAGQEEPRFRPYDGHVHGVLYRVTREDFEKLAKREGGYVVQEVKVQTYDGVTHTALAFVSNPLFKLPQEVLPTEKYLARVREGARDNYLHPAYQAFLSGISTVPGAGLGSEYYNTPSKYMGYSFLVIVALVVGAFFFQH